VVTLKSGKTAQEGRSQFRKPLDVSRLCNAFRIKCRSAFVNRYQRYPADFADFEDNGISALSRLIELWHKNDAPGDEVKDPLNSGDRQATGHA